MTVSSHKPEKTLLFAGEGYLPLELAKRMTESGNPPVIATLRGDCEIFRPFAIDVVRFHFPRLGRLVAEARRCGATRFVMAGAVPKKTIYILPALFDSLTRRTLARSMKDDHSILGSIVETLEQEGIKVIPYWQLLPEYLARNGSLSKRIPTDAEMSDIRCGADVLRVTLPCSFGQALVVADGAVVAIEAMEGTDAMIERAGKIISRGVLVKMMRADQDPRYDLPTVGPITIENMVRSGLTCMALESCRTIILEPDKTLSMADRHKIAVWGIEGVPLE